MRNSLGAAQTAIFLLANLAAVFSSANNGYEVIRLPVSDLLPQGSVERLHFDASRQLWIRTQAGYHRFNGNRLQTLYKFTGSGLRGHRFPSLSKQLIPTEDGNTWLFDVTAGLMRYNTSKKKFEKTNLYITESGTTATSALLDSKRKLWIGVSNGSVIEIDPYLGRRFPKKNIEMQLPEGDFISAMIELSDGRKAFMSYLGIMLTCSPEGANCIHTYLPEKIGLTTALKPLWVVDSQQGDLYISTLSEGIFKYSIGERALTKVHLPLGDLERPRISSHPPMSISDTGDIWVATTDGVFVISPNGATSHIGTHNSSLSNAVINTVLHIGNGEFLLGTIDGLYLARSALFENFGPHDGLRSTLMTEMATFSKDAVFLGTFRGLDVLDLETKEIRPVQDHLPGISLVDPRIMAVYQRSQETWLGFFRHGLYKYDANSQLTHRINNPMTPVEAVSDIAKISDELLAIATQNGGLHLVNTNTGNIIKASLGTDEHIEESRKTLFTVKPLKNGNIVAGSAGGVIFVSPSYTENSLVSTKTSIHLRSKDVFSILESSYGDVWAGTHGQGLYRWDAKRNPSNPKFIAVETSPNLPSNTIYSIEEDRLGMLWLATNDGLVRLNPRSGGIKVYDVTDGLLDNEFTLGASHVDRSGALYFGGYKGFTRFDPAKFVGEITPPKIKLVDLEISKKRVEYDTAYIYNPSVTLGHNDHAVDFEFSTMDIIAPGRSQFKYKLEGFDNDWVNNGNKTTATFTNLPAGDYVFRVIGANSDGVWNYDGISIPVKVLPAPWLTWWAVTLYVIAGLVLLAFTKRYYDTRLLNSEAIRQKQIMTNTAMRAMDELQDQLEQEHRLVRNLRKHATKTMEIIGDSLGIEADELSDTKARKSIYRSQQMLDCLKALESSIYFQGDMLKVNLRDAVDHMFSKILEASPPQSSEIVLANQVSDELIPIDVATPTVVLLHELVLNSINHAFNDSTGVECIEVNLLAKSGPQRWIVLLSDTGRGLSPDIDPNRPMTRGMRLISTIVSKLGGHLDVDRSRGTAFKIMIPQPTET